MRNRSIIIVSILLFSLNSFALINGIRNVNYQDFFWHDSNLRPTNGKECSLNDISVSQFEKISEKSIKLGYVQIEYLNGDPTDQTDQKTLEWVNGSGPLYAKGVAVIRSELDQACKNIEKKVWSTGNTATNTATTPAATTPTTTTYNVKTTGKKDDTKNDTSTTGSGNKTDVCQIGSTQCNVDNSPKSKVENTSSFTRSTLEKDTNGYSTSSDDFGDRKKSTVTDQNGNYIVSDTTIGKNGKQHIEMEAFDKDGKPISLKSLPPEMKDKAKAIAEVTGENKGEYSKDKKGQDAANKEADKKAKSESTLNRLQSINKKIQSEIDKCENNSGCKESSNGLKQAEQYAAQAQAEQAKCDGSSSKANFLCPTATNPQVQAVGGLMNGLSAMMPSISSAKETCAATSSVNLIGQTTLGVATAVCGGFKASCEKTCAETNTRYKAVKNAYGAVSQNLDSALEEAEGKKTTAKQDESNAQKENNEEKETEARIKISIEDKNIAAIKAAKEKIPETDQIIDNKSNENAGDIAKCDGYKADLAQIGTTAMNMMAASLQAKKCEEQLSAKQGDGSGNAPQTYTMDEMCAQPQNATSSICKCRSDNTAVGCPGHIAGSGNEGNINKTINSPGLAAMAGFGPKVKPSSAFSSGTDLGGLSDEAKVALAANGEQKPSTSMFDQAGGANAGGGGSTAANGAAAAAAKGKVAEESKSMGSSFVNAVSSFFKGGSGGKPAAKDDKFNADKYKEKIRRQIAAEQMRSEVSSASGMDNWTKIKSRYKSNSSSLIESN